MGQCFLQIIELGVLLILINVIAIAIVKGQSLQNFFEGKEDWYYLSGALDTDLEEGKEQKILKELQSLPNVENVAWQEMEITTVGGRNYSCYYFSPDMEKMKCHLDEGKWFDYQEKNQVILCGSRLGMKYKIGDTIQLNGIPCKVIGKMGSYGRFWDLSTNATRGEDIARIAREVILTNAEKTMKKEDMIYSVSAMVNLKSDTKDSVNELKKYGEPIKIRRVIEQVKSESKKQTQSDVVRGILQLLVVISTMEILREISIHGSTKEYDIYYICGMSRQKYLKMKWVEGSILLAFGIGMFLFLYYTPFFYNNSNMIDSIRIEGWNILLCIGVGVLFVLRRIEGQYKKNN